MIFLEDTLKRNRDYRSLMDDVERRVFGCGRDESGQFAPKNDCQDDGKGGGGGSQPAKSESWKASSKDVSLDKKQLQESSPLSDPGDIESLQIGQPKAVAATMSRLGIGSLDDVVAIGGGTIRGAMVSISDLDDEAVTVSISAPVDPSDPQSPRSTATVMLMEGFDGETVADYSDFHPGGNLSDASQQEGGQNSTGRLRVASILKQRMLESLVAAEKTGVSKAVSMAVGKKDDPRVKGYRLWPQFGFDAKVPRSLMAKIPDEMLLRAAGVEIPSQGTGRIPRSVVIKNLRQQVKGVTVQQLMKFRDGENWWTENGGSIELSLDLTDKDSLGYKKFQEELKKLPQLKKRNEGRSWYPIDEYEARSVDCGRVEGGRFGPKNDCQDDGKGGGSTAVRAPSRARRESWRKSEEENIFLGKAELSENSPVIGGERLAELTIEKPKKVAAALDGAGIKDLDTAVKVGGGAVRGAEVRVRAYGDVVSVLISSPVDPDDPDSGSVSTAVDFGDFGDGLEVSYGGLNTPSRISDADRLEAGTSDKTRLRIASLLQERMIESLMAAEKAKAVKATTYAAGSKGDSIYAGYRLWPQFGFDTKLDLSEFKVPDEIILASFKMAVPPSPQAAARAAEALTRNGYTLQRLISTREGKLWWDENGSSTDMTLDLRDKKSLGYKKFAKLKKILPRLKDRNVAEGRSILGWLIEEVTRRSMSLVGFLGGLAGAVERRDCGPSDKDEKGQFTKNNDCQEGAGEGGPSVAQEAAKAKARDVDVMLAGGKQVAVIDKEARDRAVEDFRARPGKGGSTTDLWDREFVKRGEGKRKNKIESTDPVFPESDLRQNGQFVAHEAVGQYLSNRHEEERRKTGAEGPASIIDTTAPEMPEAQMRYLVDSLTEDAIHAYDVLGVNPGFYSSDLEDTMRQMTGRYPEFANDDNAKFIFTTLLAITSSGQGPDDNLRDADDLYRMFREHGTVVPSESPSSRDFTPSLRTFQSLLDSFGADRTRRLLSGYTTVSKIEKVFESLADKSALEEWRARTGSSPWPLPLDSKGKEKSMISGELVDEIVPVAAIFGPKIGSFFANLSGRHDPLTMDRWLMRSVGRVTGELITRIESDGAKGRAKTAIKALEGGKWSKAKLFGVDKTHGITKAALLRSLKIQARTGVIEENGAAFIWAKAAERAYNKVPRSVVDGKSKGTYGKHPDPDIAALHSAGNSIFKSLILEQQDPRSATARRNIREVFRRVQAQIKERTGRDTDIDEIQAALWQYEKRLWKHLGAKTNIEDNSLFSAAAEGVISGRLARSPDKKNAKPFTPASRRDYRQPDEPDYKDDFDIGPFSAEQDAWESNFADLDIDLLEVLRMLEEDVEERRNFAALDARSADCGRDDGGKFGDGNTCASGPSNSKGESFRGVRRKSDKTQTKVARKLFQMRVPEKNLKSLVRSLGGKVSNTLVEIEPTRGDEGVNVFVRDRDNNETHYISIGYYGATIYTTESVSSQEVSRIQSAAKEFLPKTIDNRLWGSGSEYPIYVVNSPDETAKHWGGLSAKQRLKKERRSADCGRQEAGRFGPGNKCQDEGEPGGDPQGDGPTIKSLSSVEITSGSQWRKADNVTQFSGKDIPAKSLSSAKAVVMLDGGLLSKSLKEVGVSLDQAAKVCASTLPGSTVSIAHGNIAEVVDFTGDPSKDREPKPTVTFMSSVPVDGVADAVSVGVSLTKEDGNLFLDYGMLGVSPDAREASPIAIAREMMRSVAGSISAAEKIGVVSAHMTAARSNDSNNFQGYRIWPRMGFDGVIPRSHITPFYSISRGFFSPYGSSLPDKILSPRARAEKKAGKLTIQALYETKEGQEWWEKNGQGMDMSLDIADQDSPGWQRFQKIRDRVSRRDLSDDEFFAWLDVERRSADCGRDDGGRFGPKNQCQDDGDGTSASPSSPFDTNEKARWSPADGSEPFEGASRFGEVSSSGGKKIGESIGKMGLKPGDALAAAGIPDRAEVWLRPAEEFAGSDSFPGGEVTPVLINFDADVAGVRRGASGSSILGSRKNAETGEQEKVLYHNIIEVLPEVQQDPAKRHIAARGFYRGMVASIENARKSGIAEITLSAAGSSRDKDSNTAFKGYTIWPRMGFDATLPDRIRAKLPESLSHAKSLLDLHATREGTKWWADNGEDIDVSLRLGDRSSPQSKIVDRFIKHFMKERRERPLGTGDDWLSPEDLLRLDEMWQEVWDEGDLDDYEYVESRSVDCGREDDGKFGPQNECQEKGRGGGDEAKPRPSAGKSLSPKAKQIKQLAANGASRKKLQAAIEKAIVGKSGWLGGYTPGEASPSEVCRALGIKVANEDDLDELIANSWDYERRGIAAAIAQLSVAQQADPEGLKGSVIRIDTAKSAAKWLGVGRSEFMGVFGAYISPIDTISIIAGSEDDADHLKRLYDAGYDSTPHPAHTVIHENAHRSHYQEIERRSGIKRPAKGSASSDWDEYQEKVDDLVFDRLSRAYRGDYEWASRVATKVERISWYGTTDPFEAIAEYSTAVRLGYAKNDKDLDRLCRVALAPVPRRISR